MVLAAVEVSLVGSKPPAAVVVRIFKGERHDLGAAAPFLTTMSSLQGRAGVSFFTAKLVEHIGSGSTRFVVRLSSCIACTALAAPYVRSRVLVSAFPSAYMGRRGCQASCSRLAKR